MRDPIRAFLVLAVFLNIVLFACVNTKPIHWQQHEITFHNLLWSMTLDEEKPFTLRTGFHTKDFLKLFFIKEVEIQWRYRQFGNLVEMILFKIWQGLEMVTIRSWTLILFHIINTVLLWFLVRRLTKSELTPWVCSMIFLNSGPAFATLLFPFRILKELLMCLFMTAWLIGKSKPGEKAYGREILFLILMLCMILTDEMAFLFIPLLYLFLFLEKGNGFVNKRTLLGFIPVIATYIPLTMYFKKIMIAIGQSGIYFSQWQIQHFLSYFTSLVFIPETFRAFFAYFLRRHFGSWDLTALGIISFIGFLFILWVCGSQAGKNRRPWILSGLLIGFILVKDMLVFHAYGIHKFIMPQDATFPSTLYFSYYYPYVDSLLLVIALGILMGSLKFDKKVIVGILLAAVTVINVSNAAHTDEGVRDTVKLHWYGSEDDIVKNTLAVQDARAAATRENPVYLSFPSGSRAMFERRQRSAFEPWVIDPLGEKEELSPDFVHYASFILVQYLKAIEDGKFIISLHNAPADRSEKTGDEILQAASFYNVVSREQIHFDGLHNFTGQTAPRQWENTPIAAKIDLSSVRDRKELFVFVKGGAQVILKNQHHSVTFKQTYGYSYQMFRVQLEPFALERFPTITFAVVPATPISRGEIWGPMAR